MLGLLNIILGIGLILVGFYLHKSALQRPDPKFGRVDFLFAYVMYLSGINNILTTFNLTHIKEIFFGIEIIVVYYLFLVMIKLVPEALKEPTRAKLIEQTIEATLEKTLTDEVDEINEVADFKTRTREEIYQQIMNERSE